MHFGTAWETLSLKALCHDIRADCLPAPANEAARAHAVNEHGAWQMAGKFACVDSNLPAEARSVRRSTFQAAYLFSSLYLSVFLLFGCPYR